jgi:transcriptional regulator NrdR family protein
MECPNCVNKAQTKVKNTYKEDGVVVRRRECPSCFYTFKTKEAVVHEGEIDRTQSNLSEVVHLVRRLFYLIDPLEVDYEND